MDDSTSWKTAKYTIGMVVQPSLKINAFSRPSGKNLNEFILGLEIENLQGAFNININQISSISPSWAISFIGHELSDDFSEPISGKQTNFSYFKFIKTETRFEDINSPEKMVTDAIESMITGNAYKPVKVPDVQLVTSKPTYAAPAPPLTNLSKSSRNQWKINWVQNQYSNLKPKEIRNLFTLYLTDDVDLTVFWIPGVQRRGHHHIMGINLALQPPLLLQNRFSRKKLESISNKAMQKALFAQTVREQKGLVSTLLKGKLKEQSPLRVILVASNKITHDFSTGQLFITVVFKISNSSRVNRLLFNFKLLDPEASGQKYCPTNALTSHWLGLNGFQSQLEPQEEKEHEAKLLIPGPGVYDIQSWKVEVELEFPGGLESDENAGHFSQIPTSTHYLTVIDKPSTN